MNESQAVQVLNSYLNFCKDFQRDCSITDKNFNRIRLINASINGRKDKIREKWGELFDEVYSLLEIPEVNSRLEVEKKELQNIKQNKKQEKQKSPSESAEKKDLIIVRLITKELSPIWSSSHKRSTKKMQLSKSKTKPNSSKSNNCKFKKKQQQKTSITKIKKQSNNIKLKNKKEIRENNWKNAQAKKEALARTKEREQSLARKSKPIAIYIYGNSSIFEDIMDERRAEGKGYGGSK